MKVLHILVITLMFLSSNLLGQKKIVDQVVAIVGESAIFQSDIEQQYLELRSQGMRGEGMKCKILEEMLVQKLLLNQAQIDSVTVGEGMVEMQLEQRLMYFEEMVGGSANLLKYFNKSSRIELKEELRDIIREQLITQEMQSEIVGGIKITPSETNKYFKNLSKDSIPLVEAAVEYSHILIYPKYNEQSVYSVKQKLLEMRKRIIDGENFSTLAILYSEGPSASNGGDIGCMSKGELDPAYSKAAMSLKIGGVSNIVESSFGYHIIQLYKRDGAKICTKHILMKPKVSFEEISRAKNLQDSIINLIKIDSFTFNEAAIRFSEDEDTRANGGLCINAATGSSYFNLDELAPEDYTVIRSLKVGEISEPIKTVDKTGRVVYKVILLKSKIEPHRANLKDDYQLIQKLALEHKKQKALLSWIEEKQKTSFITIMPSFKDCNFSSDGWLK